MLDPARERILRAISFALNPEGCWPSVRELIKTFSPYMERRGHWQTWSQVLEKALIIAQQAQDSEPEANFLVSLALINQRQNNFKKAISLYRQAVPKARRMDNHSGVALWEYRRQDRQLISDPTLILILGCVPPSLMLLYIFFLPIGSDPLPADEWPAIINLTIYLYSWTFFIATLLVRRQVHLTLAGVAGVLVLELITYVVVRLNRWWGAGFALAVVLTWLLAGQGRYRTYLAIHPSFWLMVLATISGQYLGHLGPMTPWLDGLGIALIGLILIRWAYHSPPDIAHADDHDQVMQ